jgi:cytochrome d ubiquinol oxidase subunit II
VDLNLLWFVLLGVLLSGYAILDGFDLGVGILHLAARNDKERRLTINSIGPHWDGNEVWLITLGGALFAAFPSAYAAVFSGFYTAFMVLLCALIVRAVSLEFRGKRDSRVWKRCWDGAFSGASALAVFLFGVALGNIFIGVPLNAHGFFVGGFFDLIRPFPILVGLLTVSFAAMHGAIYLYMKTEEELQQRAYRWMWRGFSCSLFIYVLTVILTRARFPEAIHNFNEHSWAWAIVVVAVLALVNIPFMLVLKRPFCAFLSSSVTILALVFQFSFALYPNLVPSNISPAYSLNIFNAASSQRTLGTMATIALIGMPIVLAYTSAIYWTFRGKVKITENSY